MHWFVMQSKPRKEEFLHCQLCAHGIETFYPCLKPDPVSHKKRKRKPYFPGYLFIRVDMEKTGESILKWMPGSIGLIQFGGEYAIVPDAIVEGIRRKLETKCFEDDKARPFKVGDEVIIHSKLFDNYRAVFDGYISGQKRVQVLLKMLNDRQVRMELSIENIEQDRKH